MLVKKGRLIADSRVSSQNSLRSKNSKFSTSKTAMGELHVCCNRARDCLLSWAYWESIPHGCIGAIHGNGEVLPDCAKCQMPNPKKKRVLVRWINIDSEQRLLKFGSAD